MKSGEKDREILYQLFFAPDGNNTQGPEIPFWSPMWVAEKPALGIPGAFLSSRIRTEEARTRTSTDLGCWWWRQQRNPLHRDTCTLILNVWCRSWQYSSLVRIRACQVWWVWFWDPSLSHAASCRLRINSFHERIPRFIERESEAQKTEGESFKAVITESRRNWIPVLLTCGLMECQDPSLKLQCSGLLHLLCTDGYYLWQYRIDMNELCMNFAVILDYIFYTLFITYLYSLL